MPTSKDFSVEDEAYLSAVAAEPKMTMDEVGADIETHGHVPVSPETATQDPFTAKGSLANALDEAISADTDLESTVVTRDNNDEPLKDPTDDFRDETKGEVEGTTDTPQNLLQPFPPNEVNGNLKDTASSEPTVQQDSAVHVKDSLAEALDSIAMDGAEEIEKKPPIGKDPEPDLADYSEETASAMKYKPPQMPTSMGGDEEKPDANGLVYVTATFTVDPDKYVSNNYRPTNMGAMPSPEADLSKAVSAYKKPAADPNEEAAMSDLGSPEAKESAAQADEPTEQEEKQAAREADKEVEKEEEANEEEVVVAETGEIIPEGKGRGKGTEDEAPDKVVLDYATFIDGSSFMCFDEVSDIDYTKIAMDAGPKKPVTRANCQTTFAQCRAKNPLFCRFHGPKLLEADIRTAIKATVGTGCVVSVTKDKNSKNKFTFRLTVGCPPSKKKMVEKMVHMYLTQNPGISSSTEDWNLAGKHKQTMEFEMDLLRADKPPEKADLKGQKAVITTKADKAKHTVQSVVGETAPSLEKKAAKGEKWQTVDEGVENEWADLVDKYVHKSLLANNEEFMDNFSKIANSFDAAHDNGDAEGLKKALEDFKDEIGKYNLKTGEKIYGATETETATGGETAEAAETVGETEPQSPVQATEGNPPEGTDEGAEPAVTEGEVQDFFGPAFAKGASKQQMLDNFMELANKGTVGGKDPQGFLKPMTKMLQNRMRASGADHPMTKALVKAGVPLPEGMEGATSGGVNGETQSKIDAELHSQIDKITDPNNKDVTLDDVAQAFDALQKEYKALGGGALTNAFEYAVDTKVDPVGADALYHFQVAKNNKDIEGLKKSLKLLKDGVEAYSTFEEEGEGDGEGGDSNEEEEAAPPTLEKKPKGKAKPKGADYAKPKGKTNFAQPPVDDEAEFDKIVNEAENKGLFENNDFQKAYEGIFFDGKTDIAGKVAAMKDLMAKYEGGASGGADGAKGGGETVLPAINASAKGNGGADSSQGPSGGDATSAEGMSHTTPETADKEEQFNGAVKQYQGIAKDAEDSKALVDNEVFIAMQTAQTDLDDCKAALNELDELDQKMVYLESEGNDFVVDAVAVESVKSAIATAEGAYADAVDKFTASVKDCEDKLKAYKAKKMDIVKGEKADAVEQTVFAVAESLYPMSEYPQGPGEDVESAKDLALNLVDKTEAEVKRMVGEESGDELAKKHNLEGFVTSAIAAASEFDQAMGAFKDAMDNGDANAISEAAEDIEGKGIVVKAQFGALKIALDKAKAEAAEMKKLKAAKEGLATGGNGGDSNGGTSKKPVEPFDFDSWQKGQQAQAQPQAKTLSADEKKAKLASMSPKQKMSVAIQYLKKQIAANPPNKSELEAKLQKAEALFAKLGK